MNWWEAILFAIVEGLTEFLPISSTGHMVLLSAWLGKVEETFVQDYEIIIQGGAILAVVVHSFKRLWQPQLYLIVATAFLPTAVIGFVAKDFVEKLLGAPLIVAINLIIGGVILLFMDRWFKHSEGRIESLSFWRAIGIGMIQSVSLLPGVSRAAAALLGGRWMGLSKTEAAEFSFLLAVPTLGAASLYKLYKSPVALTPAHLPLVITGSVVAFLVALAAMRFLLTLWERYGMQPFGWYRILLGGSVLVWIAFSS